MELTDKQKAKICKNMLVTAKKTTIYSTGGLDNNYWFKSAGFEYHSGPGNITIRCDGVNEPVLMYAESWSGVSEVYEMMAVLFKEQEARKMAEVIAYLTL